MTPEDREAIRNWPLWWFSKLEAAIERGDYPAAAQAQRQLERLGVSVQYRGRRRGVAGAIAAAGARAGP